jgi:hypothetical protein
MWGPSYIKVTVLQRRVLRSAQVHGTVADLDGAQSRQAAESNMAMDCGGSRRRRKSWVPREAKALESPMAMLHALFT